MTRASSDPRPAVERLGRARRLLLTSHRRPDGDAIGSELALAELALALGGEARIINRDPAPTGLAELPGYDRVAVSETLPADLEDRFDLVVTLECPDLDRAGFEGLDRLPILNIDHHPDNPCFGEVNYLDASSPAVGEMVWKMFEAAGLSPSADAATNTFVALSTDTGDFRYSNATSRAFRAAAAMVDAGADPARVADWIHGRRTRSSVRLLGEALRTLSFECDGALASLHLDPDAFARCKAQPTDSEDIINHPRSITGVRAVALFKQWEPGLVHVSLRSKGAVDVRRVAALFGGGGHHNAAGCTLEGSLESVRRRLIPELARALGESA
jgi:phosphoesterase RecJ-like protein